MCIPGHINPQGNKQHGRKLPLTHANACINIILIQDVEKVSLLGWGTAGFGTRAQPGLARACFWKETAHSGDLEKLIAEMHKRRRSAGPVVTHPNLQGTSACKCTAWEREHENVAGH